MRIIFDYETRSPVDLLKCGVYAYVENPHTRVLVAAWAIDNEPIQVWYIHRGEPMPVRLYAAIMDPSSVLVAHNVGFERVLSAVVGMRQGFLPLEIIEVMKKPEKWSDTAARAAGCGLPRALEKVAHALHLDHQKDMEGHHLMLEMCAPRGVEADGSYIWLDDWPRLQRLGLYCAHDCEAERDTDKVLPEASPEEHAVWCATERMNDRGVLVDDKLLLRMMIFVREATAAINDKIKRYSAIECTGKWCGIGSNNRECYARDGQSALSEGQTCTHCGAFPAGHTVEIPKISNPKKIIAWLKNYGIDTEDDNGKESIGKWVIQSLLEEEDIPPIVREVLVIRRDGGKSSTAKFTSLMNRVNADNRIRGSLLYAGAAATSRWSSKGVQLQNLPRGKVVKKPDKAIEAVMRPDITVEEIEQNFGPPMVVASELVRPIFVAPDDCWLARGDYSQIEARVNAWLAGELSLLDAFRAYDKIVGHDAEGKPIRGGPDLYIVSAAGMLGVDPKEIDSEDPRRQTGKVTILACGFGGGYKALLKMARIYNLKITEEEAKKAVAQWRAANKAIVGFWYELNRAAIACMKDDPGPVHQVRSGIWFRRNESCLAMHMPSGRFLIYWYPELKTKMMPWGEEGECVTYYAEDSQKHIWRRFDAYGGLFCENVVQATARDIMAHALVKMDKLGMNPVLTVHDEAVCQLLKKMYPDPNQAAEAVRKVMLDAPVWTYGLPVDADASAKQRYVK